MFEWHGQGVCNSDPVLWLTSHEDAKVLCEACPVLAECRRYAAGRSWSGVTVAGWVAPVSNSGYPPWVTGPQDADTVRGDR